MIRITTVDDTYKFSDITYNETTRTHILSFECSGGYVYIHIDREEFGDLAIKASGSWGDGLKKYLEELEQEMNK